MVFRPASTFNSDEGSLTSPLVMVDSRRSSRPSKQLADCLTPPHWVVGLRYPFPTRMISLFRAPALKVFRPVTRVTTDNILRLLMRSLPCCPICRSSPTVDLDLPSQLLSSRRGPHRFSSRGLLGLHLRQQCCPFGSLEFQR